MSAPHLLFLSFGTAHYRLAWFAIALMAWRGARRFATAAACAVTLAQLRERLRVEVHDPCPEPPAVRVPGVDATRGRGLLIVGVLSAATGWHPTGHGKAVWSFRGADEAVENAFSSRQMGRSYT